MKRVEMIEQMINFVESTPEYASQYHAMDMLLSRMERLGMVPPRRKSTLEDMDFMNVDQKFVDEHDFEVNKWELEDEEPEDD